MRFGMSTSLPTFPTPLPVCRGIKKTEQKDNVGKVQEKFL